MRTKVSEVYVAQGEDSSILSPAWQTSGITMGSQVLSGTAGISFLPGELSTAIERVEGVFELVEVEHVEPGAFLNVDPLLRQSIEVARNEMRRGSNYLSHDEVFRD